MDTHNWHAHEETYIVFCQKGTIFFLSAMAVDQIKPKNTNIRAVLSGPPPGFPLKVKERTQVGFRGKNGSRGAAYL